MTQQFYFLKMQAVKKLRLANKYVCIHTHTMWYQHIHCITLRSTGNNLNVYVEGIDLVSDGISIHPLEYLCHH